MNHRPHILAPVSRPPPFAVLAAIVSFDVVAVVAAFVEIVLAICRSASCYCTSVEADIAVGFVRVVAG